MPKEWTKTKWDATLWKIAEEAAKSRMEKRDLTGYSQDKINAIQNELERTAKKKLDKEFSFDKIKDTEKDYVSKWNAVEAGNYLLGGGNEAYKNSYNPLVRKKMDDFAKLGPLVLGLADEGRDWYSMGSEDLFAEGEKLGYDTKSKKGKMDFLRDVGDVQQAHDRGKILEEFNRENGILSELFWPTVMEEARKQISTGRGEKSDIYTAGVLDVGTNAGMFFAPSVSGVGRLAKMPVRGATAGALLQGALEGGRQGGKTLIDDELEANLMAPILATTLGATRPGMIGTASTLAQQIPTGSANRFARGVSAATRRGNPTYMEREEFEKALNLFKNMNKVKPDYINYQADVANKTGLSKNPEFAKNFIKLYGKETPISQLSDARLAASARSKLEALYGKERADAMIKAAKSYGNENIDKKLTYPIDADIVLKDYDNLSNAKVYRDPYNFYDQLLENNEIIDGTLREGDVITKLEQAFPSKMAEAYGNDKFYKAGLRTGQILGDIGGRIEPVLKVNPFGPLSGGRINVTGGDDYKETKWYKSLSKKQQEAFDDAYQKSKRASE